MMMHQKFKLLIGVFVLALILQFTACSEDESPLSQNDTPVVPQQSSMLVDFSEFPDTNSPVLMLNIEPNDTILRGNWGWAAIHVGIWSTLVNVGLAIPVAAFTESFNHQPVQQPDGSWLWTYTLTISGIDHIVKLYGLNVNNGIEWRMLLTKVGFYNDFEWFTGFSNLPANEGTWTLNHSPDDPVPFLFIEWDRNVEKNTAEVKYTNIIPDAPENGSYIHYGKTNGVTYNRFFNIFGNVENYLINVEWNYEQHFGRVKDSTHFGDNNWYCWDEHLIDTLCPE